MMIKDIRVRSPFYIKESKFGDTSTVQVLCYHCGGTYRTHPNNLRAPNYCSKCK
jgi:hypothetical protein